jgi:ElaB/YqjD/DUF883 family membrane-anchored ribosome-binding protein
MTEKRTIEEEVDALKADMVKLRDDLKEFAALLKSSAGDRSTAGTPFSGLGQSWEDFTKKMEDARKEGDQALQDIAEQIKQHPLSSVSLAFGVGYVISKIMNLGGRR